MIDTANDDIPNDESLITEFPAKASEMLTVGTGLNYPAYERELLVMRGGGGYFSNAEYDTTTSGFKMRWTTPTPFELDQVHVYHLKHNKDMAGRFSFSSYIEVSSRAPS